MAGRRRGARQASGDVLGAQEAAWLLGAHVETVRRLARRGGVPSYKIGKDWRFSRKALTRWMETQRARQPSPFVLVIDDERSIRETVASFLETDGCLVATAGNGKQAIEAVRRHMPDVVLLDLMMPDTYGVDVLRALRSMKADLPVIIITGYPDSHLMAEALRYPPVTLLPKPVKDEVVRHTVRMLLEGVGHR